MQGEERAEMIQRLRVVGESLCSIHALLQAGAPCGQVLHQLCTVQAELQALKIRMLNCQINASKNIIQFNPSANDRLAELHRLFDLYNTLIQST
jgi:DNA-binding FrmR family transcriptional regulator